MMTHEPSHGISEETRAKSLILALFCPVFDPSQCIFQICAFDRYAVNYILHLEQKEMHIFYLHLVSSNNVMISKTIVLQWFRL